MKSHCRTSTSKFELAEESVDLKIDQQIVCCLNNKKKNNEKRAELLKNVGQQEIHKHMQNGRIKVKRERSRKNFKEIMSETLQNLMKKC